MLSRLILAGALVLIAIDHVNCNCTPPPEATPPNSILPSSYPNPKRDESVQDTYGNNVVIKDPYRFLENSDSPDTKKFIDDEMAITTPYLEKNPFRSQIQARFKELYDFAKYRGPTQKGKYYFSYRNTGLQDQKVLYVQDSLNGEAKVFLDPNTLSSTGGNSLWQDDSNFSDDGLIFGYLLSEDDSNWQTLQFKHVEKGDIFKEKLTNLKFSDVNFTPDGTGVFYEAYPDHKSGSNGTANGESRNQKLFYHALGTEQNKDILVVEIPEDPDKKYNFIVKKTDDGKYLFVGETTGTKSNSVNVVDMDKIKWKITGKLELIPIIKNIDEAKYLYVTNTDKTFIFYTNKDADNFKLISVDISNPDPKTWIDLVPEDKNNKLEWARAAHDKYLVLCYTENVKSVVQIHELATGKLVKKLPLDVGTVDNTDIYADRRYKDIFLNFRTFLTPCIVYRVDLSNSSFDLEVYKEIKVNNFDREKYMAEQVFYKSKDGTKVPMYLVYKKGLQKNGNNFTFMIGYGGFGDSWLPFFNVFRLVVISNFDGIYAVPNIRGGGEFGEKWHRDGSLDKKQNSFDDFQAAAEFLISEKYTNTKLLAIDGETNGGLLTAACLNQRPDLFGVVISDDGIHDMLRYDKFAKGQGWVSEFGTASNPKDFEYLIKYSPLHNIKIPEEADKQYPPTMLLTADFDNPVPQLHSLKSIATLQFQAKSRPNQKNPLIIIVYKDNGSSSADQTITEFSDIMCFISFNMEIKYHP